MKWVVRFSITRFFFQKIIIIVLSRAEKKQVEGQTYFEVFSLYLKRQFTRSLYTWFKQVAQTIEGSKNK